MRAYSPGIVATYFVPYPSLNCNLEMLIFDNSDSDFENR